MDNLKLSIAVEWFVVLAVVYSPVWLPIVFFIYTARIKHQYGQAFLWGCLAVEMIAFVASASMLSLLGR